jgi:hypothetical protein
LEIRDILAYGRESDSVSHTAIIYGLVLHCAVLCSSLACQCEASARTKSLQGVPDVLLGCMPKSRRTSNLLQVVEYALPQKLSGKLGSSPLQLFNSVPCQLVKYPRRLCSEIWHLLVGISYPQMPCRQLWFSALREERKDATSSIRHKCSRAYRKPIHITCLF